MNFCDATLSERDQGLFVEFDGAALRIPEEKAQAAKAHVGKTVELGVRPSDIYDTSISPVVEPSELNTAQALVEVIEPMGADSVLYLKLGEIQLVASVDSGTRAREQEPLDFCFDMEKSHLFDKETEKTIF
jgi:multiple sugar transport system ATP-binding protein